MPIREQQTTNKQHAIPQSIMSVEFKIIGDLTLKQFFFLLIFCGLAYASFMLISPFLIKWTMVIFFVGVGLSFAFLPLGDRGLDVWVVNFLRAMFLPNQFVYRKDEDVPSVFLYQNLDVLRSELITLTPTSSRRKIEAYLEQQEVPVDKLDIDEKSYILKVKEAYSREDYWVTPETGAGAPYPTTTTTVVEDVVPKSVPAIPATPEAILPPPPETPVQTPQQPLLSPAQPQDLSRLELPAGRFTPPAISVPSVQKTTPIQGRPAEPVQFTQKPKIEQPKQSPQEQIIKAQFSAQAYKPRRKPYVQDSFYSPSITPDMHAGRRFINLSQEAGRGEIVLPIRGERVLKSVEEQGFEAHEAQKIKDLDALIHDVKSKELMQKQVVEAQRAREQEEARKRALAEEARRAKDLADKQAAGAAGEEERKRLERERIQREQWDKEARAREQATKEQERLATLRKQEESLRRQKEDLIKKQHEEEEKRQKEQLEQRSKPQPIPLQPAQIKDAPTMPNIVWGMVTTTYKESKIGVPGVVVVMRNQKGEVVRAVKTSPQGRFGISTPLVNGAYTIEVDQEKKSGLNFAITAVDAKGEVIPTIEVAGKA